jgi:plasmid maintenance system antidote protein VapI
MKNPSHPAGFVLRQCIEPLGLTITHDVVGVGGRQARDFSGDGGAAVEVFGGSAATWLTQQAHYDLARVKAGRIKLKRLPFA